MARLARASKQAGISIETLIGILRAGIPIPEVVDLIRARLFNRIARDAGFESSNRLYLDAS